MELICILVVIVMWIVGTAVLTQENGIGATITGTGCQQQPDPEQAITTLIVAALRDAAAHQQTAECVLNIQNVTYSCVDLWQPTVMVDGQQVTVETIPGSNIYVSVWICLLASLNLAARWKAQRALQFAHAQQEMAFKKAQIEGNKDSADDGGDDDDANYMDEFEDADDF